MKIKATPEVEKIINKLQETPKELEEGLLKKLWRWITLPVTICLWPIRALLMACIVPTSWRDMVEAQLSKLPLREKLRKEKESNELKQQYQTIDYSTPSNNKCSMLLVSPKNETVVSDRKLVIVFDGNAEPAAFVVQNFVEYKNTKNIDNDLLVVEYPKKATTSKELVDAGVSAVLRAIKAGYEPKNITIAGYEPKNITIAGNSLGGAVSALVLKEISEKHSQIMKGQKFAGYVNHRSFAKLGDVIAALFKDKYDNSFINPNSEFKKDTKSSWLGQFLNGFAWLIGLQLDAESALSNPGSLLVEQIKFYADNKDEMIKHGAAIAARMEQTNLNTIRIKYTGFHKHNSNYSNSLYKPSKDHGLWDKSKSMNKHNKKYMEIIQKDRASGQQSLVQSHT